MRSIFYCIARACAILFMKDINESLQKEQASSLGVKDHINKIVLLLHATNVLGQIDGNTNG